MSFYQYDGLGIVMYSSALPYKNNRWPFLTSGIIVKLIVLSLPESVSTHQ